MVDQILAICRIDPRNAQGVEMHMAIGVRSVPPAIFFHRKLKAGTSRALPVNVNTRAFLITPTCVQR